MSLGHSDEVKDRWQEAGAISAAVVAIIVGSTMISGALVFTGLRFSERSAPLGPATPKSSLETGNHDQFMVEARAICTEMRDTSAIAPPGQAENYEDLAEYAESTARLLQDGYADLSRLSPPPDLEEDFDEYLDNLAAVIEEKFQQASELLSGSPSDVTHQRVIDGFVAAGNAAARLGLEECRFGD
jgi:hypothetical protein